MGSRFPVSPHLSRHHRGGAPWPNRKRPCGSSPAARPASAANSPGSFWPAAGARSSRRATRLGSPIWSEATGRALALDLDVTDEAQITAAVRTAEERFGAIDVLVNNAGYGYQAAVEEGVEAE